MAIIEIHHPDHETNTIVHVANIETDIVDVSEALEYAWRWTNNIEGSWSRGPELEFDGRMVKNGDYNPNTTVLVPLPTHCGRTYGLRSSMMGDIFKLDGKFYKVAFCGFEDAEGNEV